MEAYSPQATRFLGFYLLVIALLQAALYREVVARGADGWSLYYLEPRLGLFFLESLIRPGHPFPGYLPGASAIALGAMGCLLLLEIVGLAGYLVFEILLALPTVFLFGMIAVSHVPPGLGFSLLDLTLPAIPFTLTSILPVIYAWRVRKHLNREG
jgi:hypothetical protein